MYREQHAYMWATIAAGFAGHHGITAHEIARRTDDVLKEYKTREAQLEKEREEEHVRQRELKEAAERQLAIAREDVNRACGINETDRYGLKDSDFKKPISDPAAAQ